MRTLSFLNHHDAGYRCSAAQHTRVDHGKVHVTPWKSPLSFVVHAGFEVSLRVLAQTV